MTWMRCNQTATFYLFLSFSVQQRRPHPFLRLNYWGHVFGVHDRLRGLVGIPRWCPECGGWGLGYVAGNRGPAFPPKKMGHKKHSGCIFVIVFLNIPDILMLIIIYAFVVVPFKMVDLWSAGFELERSGSEQFGDCVVPWVPWQDRAMEAYVLCKMSVVWPQSLGATWLLAVPCDKHQFSMEPAMFKRCSNPRNWNIETFCVKSAPPPPEHIQIPAICTKIWRFKWYQLVAPQKWAMRRFCFRQPCQFEWRKWWCGIGRDGVSTCLSTF